MYFSVASPRDFFVKYAEFLIPYMNVLDVHKYSQTCLKWSPKGRPETGCLRQVTPNTGSVTLYFNPRDPENVAA